jgi:acyl-CoA synthetase (AMP-forming)/AMP-acid ligase II
VRIPEEGSGLGRRFTVSSAEVSANGDIYEPPLAHYNAPRVVVFGELPKTSTRKILKFELRERAEEIIR